MAEVGSFEGRTAVVTGGGAGIGLSICEVIVDRGGSVVVADVDSAVGEAAAEALGSKATSVVCDVRDAAQLRRAIEVGLSSFGSVDVWVNNAGITRDAMLHKMTEEQWDQVIDVHLKGTFLGTRAFALHCRSLPEPPVGASVVNISSIVAKAGNIGQMNYVAAKAGIVGMTKTAAREMARMGVRVNAVQPGFIDTAMTRAIPESIREDRIAQIPLGRAGRVDEIARVVAFLASDEASYVTGVTLAVTGGRLM